MQSWSKISIVSEAKNNIIDSTIDVNTEKNVYQEFLTKFIADVHKKHQFSDTIVRSSQEAPKRSTAKNPWKLNFKYPFNKNISLKVLLNSLIEIRDVEDNSLEKVANAQKERVLTKN